MIRVENLTTAFGSNIIHDNISFEVKKCEIFGIIGGSGSGKTTLLKQLILLQKPQSGKIYILNEDITDMSEKKADELKKEFGVLFQFGALFSSQTILENVMIPLIEHTNLPKNLIEKLALLKIQMVGLAKKSSYLYPSQISGGMKKRAGLARALALDPKILFLDEPTSGLDPSSARAFEELILRLNRDLKVTVVMITHDKDTIKNVLTKIAILGNKKVLAIGTYDELCESNSDLINSFMK